MDLPRISSNTFQLQTQGEFHGFYLDILCNCITIPRAELKESKKIEKQAKALEAETAAKSKDAEKEKPKEEAKKEKPKEEASKDKDEKKPELKKETKAKDLLKEDDKKDDQQPTPLSVKPAQNWCDFFFIIDSLSYNIDMCDFILFMNKLHPTITNIDTKKVNVDASYLETGTNTLVFSYTEAGILETLLGELIKVFLCPE